MRRAAKAQYTLISKKNGKKQQSSVVSSSLTKSRREPSSLLAKILKTQTLSSSQCIVSGGRGLPCELEPRIPNLKERSLQWAKSSRVIASLIQRERTILLTLTPPPPPLIRSKVRLNSQSCVKRTESSMVFVRKCWELTLSTQTQTNLRFNCHKACLANKSDDSATLMTAS